MYILKCARGEYYIGSTNNLDRRIQEHQNGMGSNFSWKYLPVELIYHEEFPSVEDAFKREKQIQKWSRAKKEALIRGDIETLKDLAKNHTDHKRPGFHRKDPFNEE